MSETTSTTPPATDNAAPLRAVTVTEASLRGTPILAALAYYFDIPAADVQARIEGGAVTVEDARLALRDYGRALEGAAMAIHQEGVGVIGQHPSLRALASAHPAETNHVVAGDGGAAEDDAS